MLYQCLYFCSYLNLAGNSSVLQKEDLIKILKGYIKAVKEIKVNNSNKFLNLQKGLSEVVLIWIFFLEPNTTLSLHNI